MVILILTKKFLVHERIEKIVPVLNHAPPPPLQKSNGPNLLPFVKHLKPASVTESEKCRELFSPWSHDLHFKSRVSQTGLSVNSTSSSRLARNTVVMTWTTSARMSKARHLRKYAPTPLSSGNEKTKWQTSRRLWRRSNEEKPRFNEGSASRRLWRLRYDCVCDLKSQFQNYLKRCWVILCVQS